MRRAADAAESMKMNVSYTVEKVEKDVVEDSAVSLYGSAALSVVVLASMLVY